ncbi:ABC transporter ATP-binding protein [uncultured Pseudokineococcus sp.]|uniref:ATP-binding cassette domain-containing protein n=1 Tax=uncultured Pseudokineococcus sp. TaxID=1642928 RepID=UPI0026330BB4|nr:ABC transporter ATP-binding protein [uncultured Pseudokineococcus sp.]
MHSRRSPASAVLRSHPGGSARQHRAAEPASGYRGRGHVSASGGGEAVLETRDLRVEVGAGRGVSAVPLLHGVDLEVRAGERVAVLGASGSGKSLTAAAVRGQLAAGLRSSGSLRVLGQEVLDVPGARRPGGLRPAAVLQDPSAALHPLVAVGAQVAMPLRARRTPRAEVRAEVLELLAAVGLEDPARVADGRPAELSGGQRQRAAIALALACEAPLLVADEPTTALDTVTQASVLEVLGERTGPGGPALLLITHDLAVAAALCSRAVVVADGRVVESGSLADVLAAPAHPATRALVDAARASGTTASASDAPLGTARSATLDTARSARGGVPA